MRQQPSARRTRTQGRYLCCGQRPIGRSLEAMAVRDSRRFAPQVSAFLDLAEDVGVR